MTRCSRSCAAPAAGSRRARASRWRSRPSRYTARYDAGISRWFAEREDDFPGSGHALLREGARPLLRREPPPARRLLRAGRGAHAPAVDGVQAARQGAVVQQPPRPRLRPPAASRSSRCPRPRSSSTTTRAAAPWAPRAPRPSSSALATDPHERLRRRHVLQPARSTARWRRSSTRCSWSWSFAPGYDDDALEILQQKPNVRHPRGRRAPTPRRSPSRTSGACAAACSCRTATSGLE